MNIKKRFEKKVVHGNGCWLWSGARTERGYGRFIKSGKIHMAHRIAYEIYVGPMGSLDVLHHCDNPPCVRPSHLFLGTQGDNNRDRHQKGRDGSAKGSLHGRSRLRDENIKDIRNFYPMISLPRLSNHYGVGISTIHHIVKNRTWRCI